MGVEGFLVGAALLIAFFWIVGKLLIKAVKFIMVVAIGIAVVAAICAVLISPIFILYAVVAGGFGFYAKSARERARGDEDFAESEDQ